MFLIYDIESFYYLIDHLIHLNRSNSLPELAQVASIKIWESAVQPLDLPCWNYTGSKSNVSTKKLHSKLNAKSSRNQRKGFELLLWHEFAWCSFLLLSLAIAIYSEPCRIQTHKPVLLVHMFNQFPMTLLNL